MRSDRYGTSTGGLRQDNPTLMQSDPHLLAEGDTLANLASRQQETVSALRLFNPQLARYPASAPLPAGVTIQLPVGSWVLLPPQRGVGGLAEL